MAHYERMIRSDDFTEGSVAFAEKRAAEANLPVCGGSGVGFINTRSGAVASFYGAGHLKPGGFPSSPIPEAFSQPWA